MASHTVARPCAPLRLREPHTGAGSRAEEAAVVCPAPLPHAPQLLASDSFAADGSREKRKGKGRIKLEPEKREMNYTYSGMDSVWAAVMGPLMGTEARRPPARYAKSTTKPVSFGREKIDWIIIIFSE